MGRSLRYACITSSMESAPRVIPSYQLFFSSRKRYFTITVCTLTICHILTLALLAENAPCSIPDEFVRVFVLRGRLFSTDIVVSVASFPLGETSRWEMFSWQDQYFNDCGRIFLPWRLSTSVYSQGNTFNGHCNYFVSCVTFCPPAYKGAWLSWLFVQPTTINDGDKLNWRQLMFFTNL